MNRPCLSLIALALCASITVAQDKSDFKKPAKKTPTVTTSSLPVTNSEAAATFSRLEAILAKLLGPLKFSRPSYIKPGSGSVNRLDVAREFTRIESATSPYFKVNLKPVEFEPKRIRASAVADRAMLGRLVSKGYVGEYAPVASGPKETLTPIQFGDAVGFFASRIMEACHLPSTKWTPTLHK